MDKYTRRDYNGEIDHEASKIAYSEALVIWIANQPSHEPNQDSNGKAFEFACLLSAQKELGSNTLAPINREFLEAERKFNAVSDSQRQDYQAAAQAVMKRLVVLEPRLLQITAISIQSDRVAIPKSDSSSDVSDLIFSLPVGNIGMSLKTNSISSRSFRLRQSFIEDNFGLSPSNDFRNHLQQFSLNVLGGVRTLLWSEAFPDKELETKVFMPMLVSFEAEFNRLAADVNFASLFMNWVLSSQDYYKVSHEPKKRFVNIEAINVNGSLLTTQQKLPTEFLTLQIKNKKGKLNSIEVELDNGFRCVMRIKNKDGKHKKISSRMLSALAFEIEHIVFPSTYQERVSY